LALEESKMHDVEAVRLRITHCSGKVEERTLRRGRYRVGRDAQIMLADPYVSARHAELEVHAHGVIITDLGSTNGTFDASGNQLVGPSALLINRPVWLGASTITWLDTAAVPRTDPAWPRPERLALPEPPREPVPTKPPATKPDRSLLPSRWRRRRPRSKSTWRVLQR
jgi:pSer/pThr/pTyr-binding forkhead associated (FHA) protein